jgi:hypothetical protein
LTGYILRNELSARNCCSDDPGKPNLRNAWPVSA